MTMQRIVIIGATGSGKSTLAQRIAAVLALPVIDLDDVSWQPGWVPISKEQLHRSVDRLTAGPAWVINGNYSLLRDLVWSRADAVIWLDYPLPLVLRQLLRRTCRRIWAKESVCGGNVETVSRFFSKDSIMLWLFKSYWKKRREYGMCFASPSTYPQARFVRLRSREQMVNFLRHFITGHPMTKLAVAITTLPHAEGLALPAYATLHAAGMDLCAAVMDDMVVAPGQRVLVPTGLSIALPAGYEAQVRPRSGLALKYGLTVLNSPGTIDADYRGEVQVILVNLGDAAFTVTRGLRIAQMVVAAYAQVEWERVTALPESARGAGGFGSTGVK